MITIKNTDTNLVFIAEDEAALKMLKNYKETLIAINVPEELVETVENIGKEVKMTTDEEKLLGIETVEEKTLKKMKNEELIALCIEKGVDVTGLTKKAEFVEKLLGTTEE